MKNKARALYLFLCIFTCFVSVSHAAPLRRAVSPTAPMYLMQVQRGDGDTPQQIINLIPNDIKPYVVLMDCHPAQSGNNTNGFAQADEFLNVCYSNGVWAMIQCASGGYGTMNNIKTNDYETLFQRYPNLIGFAFAEQNWGFGTTTAEFGQSSFQDRLELFAKLLPLCNIYGGYLYSSEMQSVSNSGLDPIAKLKSNVNFRNATATYKNNFIVGSKFTMSKGFYDNESACLGTYLSGHAGNYAIRYDMFSWSYSGRSRLFGPEVGPGGDSGWGTLDLYTCPEPAMGIPIVDHVMLSGATVIDGPEVPFISTSQDGRLTPAFTNMFADIFRKILDKTIKIANISTVRSNCPIAVVSDQNNNTPASLYDGLYRVTGDGTLGANITWFKSSGRYFTIPELFSNGASEVSGFKTYVLQSQYSTRWPTQQDKVNEFNSYCPVVSTGNAFVARRENRLFAYNMWVNSNIANNASIPLQYNTASSLDLTFPAHTFAVITENNSSIQVYLNNYRTDKEPLYSQYPTGMTWAEVQAYNISTFIPNPTDDTANTIRTSTIKVSGCSSAPTYTLTDRGDHPASTVSTSFSGGVFTLNVTGNGPSDITINCSGTASRPAVPPSWTMTPPSTAPVSGPPTAPTGLSAIAASSSQIDLSWTAGVGAASYKVKRATVRGGPYTTIASGISDTHYSNTVAANSTYYYVVSAVNSAGESANSLEAIGTTAPLSTLTIGPVADAYVRDGTYSANNFGTASQLQIKTDATDFTRESVLKFDVRSLTNATSVKLILTPESIGSSGSGINVECELLGSDTWTETGITWNTKPAGSGTIFGNTTSHSVGAGEAIIVTTAALDEAGGDGYLSVRIRSTVTGANSWVYYASREHATASYRPVLEYTVPSGIPAEPTGLAASAASSSQIDLTWAALSGATSYNLKRATVSGGPYTTIATGVTAASFSDTALSANTTYYYVVSAVAAGGEGANSAQASAKTRTLAPTGLSATAASSSQVNLSWTASSGATSYNVKRATVSGGPYTTIATNVTATSYSNTGLSASTTYYYVVSAVNTGGESANSAQASATTLAPVPSVPTGLTATRGSNQVSLTWTASSGATSYNVKRSTVSGSSYTNIATGVTTTSYTDSTAVNGTTYYYVVSAVNASGESANSAQAVSVGRASIKFEAESGTLGSLWAVSNSTSPAYITAASNNTGNNPGLSTRVATYTVTFPTATTYQLYARVRIGTGGANDDSFLYAASFGQKSVTNNSDWVVVNNTVSVGFTNSTDVVTGGGTAGTGVWKWINLSKFTNKTGFAVSAGSLTQTFQIGSREDGFNVDKVVFASAYDTFTVSQLDGL